jgi:tetratricopeptide (TPR) repeat protein
MAWQKRESAPRRWLGAAIATFAALVAILILLRLDLVVAFNQGLIVRGTTVRIVLSGMIAVAFVALTTVLVTSEDFSLQTRPVHVVAVGAAVLLAGFVIWRLFSKAVDAQLGISVLDLWLPPLALFPWVLGLAVILANVRLQRRSRILLLLTVIVATGIYASARLKFVDAFFSIQAWNWTVSFAMGAWTYGVASLLDRFLEKYLNTGTRQSRILSVLWRLFLVGVALLVIILWSVPSLLGAIQPGMELASSIFALVTCAAIVWIEFSGRSQSGAQQAKGLTYRWWFIAGAVLWLLSCVFFYGVVVSDLWTYLLFFAAMFAWLMPRLLHEDYGHLKKLLDKIESRRQAWLEKRKTAQTAKPEAAVDHVGQEAEAGDEKKSAGGWRALFSLRSIGITLLTLSSIFLVLVLVNELTTAGKTMVGDFQYSSPGKDPKKEISEDIGQAVKDRLFDHLVETNKSLQPPAALLGRDLGSKLPSTRYLKAEKDTNVEDIFSKSEDLKFGPLSVPIKELAKLFQSPIRSWLGTKVVSGRLEQNASGYILFASSSSGESWRVFRKLESPKVSPGPCDATDTPESVSATSEEPQMDVIDSMVKELAFRILTQSKVEGMTTCLSAFELYETGVKTLDQSRPGEQKDLLAEAIRYFKRAIDADHTFALAHYRLGRALLEEQQPVNAAQAFAAGAAADSDVVRGATFLAPVLYSFPLDSYESDPGAVLQAPSVDYWNVPNLDLTKEHARGLLKSIIANRGGSLSGTDLFSVLFELCDDGTGSERKGWDRSTLLAIYYCSQAQFLLPDAIEAGPTKTEMRGTLLNNLGLLADGLNTRVEQLDNETWICSEGTWNETQVTDDGHLTDRGLRQGPYWRIARSYYSRAVKLKPDPVLTCNAAIAAWADGDHDPMKRLDSDPDAHLRAARAYDLLARQAKGVNIAVAYFRLALDEDERVIQADFSNRSAREDFAYTFWKWLLRVRDASPELWPTTGDAKKAESYLREELRMIQYTQSVNIRASAESTLGEVLLAQGRATEAAAVFEETLKLAESTKCQHCPLLNETRWDLAQAKLCAAGAGRDGDVLRSEARALLQKIAATEQNLEVRPYRREGQVNGQYSCILPTQPIQVIGAEP